MEKLSEESYQKGYQQFLGKTDQKQIAIQWFSQHYGEIKEVKSLLSIGCGTGEVDLLILKELPNLKYYLGIDPNQAHIDSFSNLITKNNIKVKCELNNYNFEQLEINRKFDLIVFGQSLYYPNNKIEALEKAYNLVNEDGSIIIFHTTENKGISQLKDKFEAKAFRYTDIELEEDLKFIGVSYSKTIIPSYINIQDLEQAKPMVEFMLEKPCTDSDFKEACNYIQKQSQENYFEHPLVIFRINSALNSKEYADIYTDFRQRTDAVEVMSKWINNFLQNVNIKKVLSVGCGRGIIDKNFLNASSLEKYIGIDPNSIHLKECESNLLKDSLSGDIQFQFFNGQYIEYFSDEKFDLVLMSHVLYYLEYRIGAICKAINSLEDEGFLMIFHQTEKGIYQLQNNFGRTQHTYCSLEIKKDLEKLQLPYTYEELPSSIYLKESSEKLINFFLERRTSKGQLFQVQKFLNDNYPNGVMNHPVGVFVIKKREVDAAIADRLLSFEDYATCFGEFINRSDQYQALVSWFEHEYLPKNSNIKRILSVGCGTGEFDLKLVSKATELEDFTGLEPNIEHIKQLKANVNERQVKYKVNLVQNTLEKAIFTHSFDIILFAHSLYYISDKFRAIKNAINLLSDGGEIMIIHEPFSGGMFKINEKFGLLGRTPFASDHLKQFLTDERINFRSSMVKIWVNVEEPSNKLISFLLERKAEPSEIAEVKKYLLDEYSSGKLPEDTEIIIIPKQEI